MKLAVYSYWTWLPGEGLGKIACKMRSREQIAAMGGIPILTSQILVDEDDLGQDGSFKPLAAPAA